MNKLKQADHGFKFTPSYGRMKREEEENAAGQAVQ